MATNYSSLNDTTAKKPEREKVESVVKNAVKPPKKTFGGKIVDAFFEGDVKNVKRFVVDEILVPSGKKAVSDIVSGFSNRVSDSVDILLYGETKRRKVGGRVSYDSYYNSPRRVEHIRSAKKDLRYVVETLSEAKDVISSMDGIIDVYGRVSVNDYLDLLGLSGDYTDNDYGWTNIASAEPISVPDGWIIKLPQPRLLK